MEKLSIKQIVELIMKQAEEKGFGVTPEEINTLEKIALIHSEISEAMEAYGHKNIDGRDGFAEELADAIIRIFHLAGVYKIDLQKEILNKIKINQDREWDWNKMNESHI